MKHMFLELVTMNVRSKTDNCTFQNEGRASMESAISVGMVSQSTVSNRCNQNKNVWMTMRICCNWLGCQQLSYSGKFWCKKKKSN